jgi:hypothetical protein
MNLQEISRPDKPRVRWLRWQAPQLRYGVMCSDTSVPLRMSMMTRSHVVVRKILALKKTQKLPRVITSDPELGFECGESLENFE